MSRQHPILRAVAGPAALALLLGLSGCALLGGGDSATTLYAPQPRIEADPSWPNVDWQLTIASVDAAAPVDSARIAVRPVPNELQVYKGASWALQPAELVERTVLRTLEDSGKLPGVAPAGRGVTGDYRLLLDVRRFESDYAGEAQPRATIEIAAKLLHGQDKEVVASQTFLSAVPAGGTAVPVVVEAFERSLREVGRDVAAWVLVTGQAHQAAHRD